MTQLRRDLNEGKYLRETADESLPVCWRGAKPFTKVTETNKYFKALALSVTTVGKAKKSQLLLSPESYLIISVGDSEPPTPSSNSDTPISFPF